MMNKDFFSDPRDKEIVRLKEEIAAFKKYDKRRIEYYEKVLEENKQLKKDIEWYKEENELLSTGKNGKFRDKFIEQQKQLKSINQQIYILKHKELFPDDFLKTLDNGGDALGLMIKLRNAQEKIKKQNTQIQRQKENINKLIQDLYQL